MKTTNIRFCFNDCTTHTVAYNPYVAYHLPDQLLKFIFVSFLLAARLANYLTAVSFIKSVGHYLSAGVLILSARSLCPMN